jgi:hypothetical protein
MVAVNAMLLIKIEKFALKNLELAKPRMRNKTK